MPLWAPSWAVTNRSFNFPVFLGKKGNGMPATAKQKPRQLQISGYTLVAATYLSGQPTHLLSAWGWAGGYAFRMWRTWAALGLLEPSVNSGVVRASEYKELDSTEKSHLNYVLGGTLAKAYAADKLGVPWLAHLSLATRIGYNIKFQGSRRPDYLGYANNQQDLVVAEAKGRQRSDSRLKAQLDGKAQTHAVHQVNGAVPVNRYGVLAEAKPGQTVSLYAVDPADSIKVDFDALQWIRAYYAFARQLAEECADDPRPGDGDRWASMDLQVPAPITEWLDQERGLDAWPVVERRVKIQAEEQSRRREVSVLPDLLAVHAR